MPPKRARKSASKLAQSLDLSADEEAEVREAWEMFMDEETTEGAGQEAIKKGDVRKVLMALGLESSREELQEILETVDPDDDGYVVYERFLEVTALKMRYRDDKEEVQKAYSLFTNGTDGPIRLADLRRIANELKEEVTDEQLKDMLAEACTKDIGRGVDMKDFEGVMKRAGVF